MLIRCPHARFYIGEPAMGQRRSHGGRVSRQYYYLVSLLPALVFGNKTPISSGTFMQYCRTHLAPKDNALLQEFTAEENHLGFNRFYDEWYMWDHDLKKELGHVRAAIMSPEGNRRWLHPPGTDMVTRDIFHEVLSARTPLEAEVILARVRWEHLDKMEFGYYFDFEKIIAYALKLKIMERLDLFEPVKGGIRFTETLDTMLSAAKQLIACRQSDSVCG